MKGLTLIEPWAALIAQGRKQFETRSWKTPYRGAVAIHAGMKTDKQFMFECGYSMADLGNGHIIAVADLVNVISTNDFVPDEPECWYGDYSPNRWAWQLSNVRALSDPMPCKGMLGLWALPEGVDALIRAPGETATF